MVDDEMAVCQMTARMLAGAGCQTIEAHSAEEAIEVLARLGDRIGLVVSDVVMPGMGGFALADRIGERWPDVPILLISGETGRRDDYRGSFLRKPFSMGQLLAAARDVLHQHNSNPTHL